MHFSKSVLAVTASLVSLGLAADPLSFTSWPKEPLALGLASDWLDVLQVARVTLAEEDGDRLNRVSFLFTGQAKGGTFTWTPDDSVKKADTYAFQIKQKDQTQ
jgi:hypothetical protein